MNKRTRYAIMGLAAALISAAWLASQGMKGDQIILPVALVFLLVAFIDLLIGGKDRKPGEPVLMPFTWVIEEAKRKNIKDWVEAGFGEAFDSLKDVTKHSNSRNLTWIGLKRFQGKLFYIVLNSTSQPVPTRLIGGGEINTWKNYRQEMQQLSKDALAPTAPNKLDMIEAIRDMDIGEDAQAEAIKNLPKNGGESDYAND